MFSLITVGLLCFFSRLLVQIVVLLLEFLKEGVLCFFLVLGGFRIFLVGGGQ